jgi:hypothetical protein
MERLHNATHATLQRTIGSDPTAISQPPFASSATISGDKSIFVGGGCVSGNVSRALG